MIDKFCYSNEVDKLTAPRCVKSLLGMFCVPPKFRVCVGVLCGLCGLCVLCGFKIQNFTTGSFFSSKTQNPTPPPLDVPMSSGFISFFFDFQINNFNMAGMRPQLCCAAFPALLYCPLLLSAVLCSVLWARRSTAQHSTAQRALNTQYCSAMLVFSDRCRSQLTEVQSNIQRS